MQRLELLVQGPHTIDDLISLQNYINSERGLRAAASVERRPPEEGALGAALDLVNIALSPGGTVIDTNCLDQAAWLQRFLESQENGRGRN